MIIKDKGYIDARNTMYPCSALMVKENYCSSDDYNFDKGGTIYGYSFSNVEVKTINPRLEHFDLDEGNFFSFPADDLEIKGNAFVVFRLGFRGQNVCGSPDYKGRLSYIDGCSDSLLVYPPRRGDPSLNLLYFPPGIRQSWHTHPSVRFGVVIQGEGIANTEYIYDLDPIEGAKKAIDVRALKTGSMFYLEENEPHRFITNEKAMRIIAFHPETDWGPTDENHPMLNRTYVK